MARDELLQLQSTLVTEIGASHYFKQKFATPPAELSGLNPQHLSLLARMTHAKRLGKIARVLPVTYGVLNPELPTIFPQFVEEFPMRGANGVANAIQFHHFLRRSCNRGNLRHSFVGDLSACESALALVSLKEPTQSWRQVHSDVGRPVFVRRAEHVVFITCSHDVQPLLAMGTFESDAVTRRAVHLTFAPGTGNTEPRVFELHPALFVWAQRLRRWQRPKREMLPLIQTLCKAGVLQCHHSDTTP
ncbi:hypothetical protein [Rhodococcus sp. 105337]|uniref:hypothetical protein n=1 Tax=Rhodococcus sp. 105337 TaxID=2725310 RepID=UPI00146EC751|nr:hypothetical protein [Rhodococcus sp. 105337]NME81486.1 hypothetical protein [Rhodococcus sp. 105337]